MKVPKQKRKQKSRAARKKNKRTMDRVVFLLLSNILPATGLGRRNENSICCYIITKQRCCKEVCDRRIICDCDVMIPFDIILFELKVVYRRFNLARTCIPQTVRSLYLIAFKICKLLARMCCIL
jgi:hypothetical protein